MATMTLNMEDREMEALSIMADEQDLSKTQMVKQALRFYQLVMRRLKDGETLHFSGDKDRVVEFVGPGFNVK